MGRARLQAAVHPGLPGQLGRAAAEAAVDDHGAAVGQRARQTRRRGAAHRVQRQARQRRQRRRAPQLGLHNRELNFEL